MDALVPAWPPGAVALDHDGPQPLRCGVHRGGESGRAGADDGQVVERLLRLGAQPERLGQLHRGWCPQRLAVGDQDERQLVRLRARELDEVASLVVALDVEPAVRHVVAGQERLGVSGLVRPRVADHADHRVPVGVIVAPVAEQVVDDGVEPVLGWVPRLEEVVVETDLVDRLDRHVGVGVRREQQQLGVRRLAAYLGEHLDAGHPRHPLIGGHQGDRATAQGELGEELERLVAGRRAEHAIVVAVAGAQVTRHCPGDDRIVVHRQDRRLGRHATPPRPRGARRYRRGTGRDSLDVASEVPGQGAPGGMLAFRWKTLSGS